MQHLIEECILFNMNKEECMDALAKHANILPVITSTGKSDSYLILYSVYCNFVETWLMLFELWIGCFMLVYDSHEIYEIIIEISLEGFIVYIDYISYFYADDNLKISGLIGCRARLFRL